MITVASREGRRTQPPMSDALRIFFHPDTVPRDRIYPVGGCYCFARGNESEFYYSTGDLLASWDSRALCILQPMMIEDVNMGPAFDVAADILAAYVDEFVGWDNLPSFTLDRGCYRLINHPLALAYPIVFDRGRLTGIRYRDCRQMYDMVFQSSAECRANPVIMLKLTQVLPDDTFTEEELDRLRQLALDRRLGCMEPLMFGYKSESGVLDFIEREVLR